MNNNHQKSQPVLQVNQLKKMYGSTKTTILTVLDGVNFELYPGEIVGLVAPSGTGKSTLLHQIGLLEKPTDGEINILNTPTRKLTDSARTKMRLNNLGFVYQFHHLLPEFTALENIMMPQVILDKPPAVAERQALKMLESLGLEARKNHRPTELSGGEQQRVAILRALANTPNILLADEPTGNLDESTADSVFKELIHMVRNNNMAALIATHNLDLAKKMDRVITIKDRKVQPWTP